MEMHKYIRQNNNVSIFCNKLLTTYVNSTIKAGLKTHELSISVLSVYICNDANIAVIFNTIFSTNQSQGSISGKVSRYASSQF